MFPPPYYTAYVFTKASKATGGGGGEGCRGTFVYLKWFVQQKLETEIGALKAEMEKATSSKEIQNLKLSSKQLEIEVDVFTFIPDKGSLPKKLTFLADMS